MSSRIQVTLHSNVDKFIKAKDEDVERALEIIGLKAEGYAKELAPVDTGLLRNSITHAVAGKGTSISSYESNSTHADTPATRRAGTAGMPAPKRHGEYSSSIGEEKEQAVYVGTNVEYAEYVEMGTSKTKAQPFLRPAVEDHIAEYENILENELRSGV